MATKKILILGAGFGGLETAVGLGAVMNDGYEITLIDRNDSFFVGFSKIDVLFGRRTESEVRYRYADLRAEGVRFVRATIESIDTDAKTVATTDGSFGYDYLVVALGADLDHGATPGFEDSGAHEFYTMAGAVRLRPVLEALSEGKVVLGILGVPYKCPPAPYEVAFLLHEQLTRRGVRDRVTLEMVIPTPRPVPNPGVSDALERLLAEREIALVSDAPIRSIDAGRKTFVAGALERSYHLFVGVPVHVPPAVVRGSKLADAGFVKPSPLNLETSLPGVYAIGDVTTIPAGDKVVPKAGAFAEDAARTVVSDILMKEGLGESLAKFCARGACYFELGGGAVARVDADFLGGDRPKMALAGPSAEFSADKLAFESERRDRWFKGA